MAQVVIKGIGGLKPYIERKKAFLVADHIERYPFLEELFTNDVLFSDITPNPVYEEVVEGVDKFNACGCDIIVAIGGGSTIDIAKCIKLFSGMNSETNYLEQEKKDSGVSLIAIPTTAGTGSESTKHAVIYYNGEKQSIAHESIIPNVAVLEPAVLKGLPLYQKKCTMLDALCQAIESWWSINSNKESIAYSKAAIALIRDNWQKYIDDNDEEASSKIMEAANYAGRAINITATTAPHAMSYKLSSIYKIPHGHAVALCLTQVWPYMLNHTDRCVDSRGKEYLERTLSDITVTYDWFMDLMDKLGMEYPVSSNRESDIAELTVSVNPIRLKNNPVKLDENVLRSMYEVIVK